MSETNHAHAASISPLAYIHPEAIIGENCEIGPFCYIDKNVVIGKGNRLMNSVTLLSGTRMGDENLVFPGAVIGAIPQDLKFQGEETTAEVGNKNTIRENVTINRGTAAKGKTVVGSNNLLMEGMHVAHDVIVGNGCIIGNSTKLAGEVIVDDFAIISAAVLVHQFCRIGSYVMVSGGTRTGQDIPPYTMAAREPVAYSGLNIVGLRRRGFAPEVIENIHNAYRILYQRGKLFEERIAEIRSEIPMSKEIEYILDFVTTSKRGIIK
ncbi:MAG: acyl-ACP--UDP-N-acetylglucosamine O-acyltransferase [Bacteroidaceae bacterium]|nr:acyl-ACP--UDP-N-acetylglucosamine O-acyltransferase [Bacteroidaceae bacterium]